MTRAWIGLALVLLNLLVYAQVRDYPFINFDDTQYVVENGPVAAGLTGQGLAWAFSSPHAGNWHPLTWISHMIDVEVFGLDAGKHHLVNVLIHTVSTLLLFLVFARMTMNVWASAFVAAMFAVHPTHVASSGWRRLCLEKVPLIVLSAASSLVTFIVQRDAGAVRALEVLPFERRIAAATLGYGEYLLKTLGTIALLIVLTCTVVAHRQVQRVNPNHPKARPLLEELSSSSSSQWRCPATPWSL